MNVCSPGNWRAGLGLFQRMGEHRQAETAITRSTLLLVAGGRQDRWRHAFGEGFRSMRGMGPAPRVIACSSALSACEDAERWAEALDLLGVMQADGLSPNVFSFSSSISALEKCACWILSLDLLRQMEGRTVLPNEVSFSGVVGACEKAEGLASHGRGTELLPTLSRSS
ncbi:unnamed protein product [Symbiodinium natans]|uniref:Pentatricopeptide repeat-containing protein n=1 Tax=Symbiodinium natans TaxID=878477 RepID=A0A812MII6_9DINO|nr:unnamed protein product [Symbiodinium natans]